ncbi:MAG: transcription-repair coupling factor [Helicobacter sp.]|nr:transcription-repair coupling factor [Helicobacter sp.]
MAQSSLYEFLKTQKDRKDFILLTHDKQEAQKLSDVALFLGYESFVLPDFKAIFGDDLRSYQEELLEIFTNLKNFYASKNPKILFSPLQTLLNPMPKETLLEGFTLQKSQTYNFKDLKEKLLYLGYEFVDLVEVAGEVSIRGDILDIFPPSSSNPLRISFFDDEIENIKIFDTQTQLSIKEELDCITLAPAMFSLNQESYEELLTQIKQDSNLDNLSQKNLITSYGFWFLGEKYSQILPLSYPTYFAPQSKVLLEEIASFGELDAKLKTLFESFSEIPQSQNYTDFQCNFNNIPTFLSFHQDKKITILSKTQAQCKQVGLNPLEHKDYHFIFERDYGIWILGKEELILSLNVPTKPKKKAKSKILLDELKSGDYVVHIDYGIGLFNGIIQANVFGARRDFIELKYLGEDKLLLPIENLDRIDRYITDGGGIPILDKLGKGSFAKLKEKVREKLFVIANEIIALAAKRELIDGIVMDCQKEEILIFQNQSGFYYTQDQEEAIREIFKDLSSQKVMDRLLSGDVGFGKTEVAMNALFAAYLNGYQSVFVAPTTLLVYQHYQTLKSRLDSFGVCIKKLDRYVSTKEKKEVLKGLKEGSVDILIGTHAVFGAEFKNLALIVVDEEHKFGVKQKEKIKNLSNDIHLLSLSATPIPRTLNMALSHIKSLSELKTSPSGRLAVRTFVKEYNPALFKEVVARELRRGGQIFYIHNNIATIAQKKQEILSLMPHLKIAILHSQISAQESEDTIMAFAKGEFHLLLCTSIVESGIHLPNVNTILVDRSDCFGIADLHQLRGRVGRGDREGFCYFLLEDSQKITPEAQKRLVALEKNSYLGSGGALAYHDLEIRGGGNLLGEAQSGHIKNIGYSLYLRMLEEAIYQLSGNIQAKQNNVDVKLSVAAFLNAELIATEKLRLELYRRLSRCEDIQSVYGIESEIEERFGELDIYSKQFLDLIIIKILAREVGIVSILNYQQNITFVPVSGDKLTITAKSKDDDEILKAVLEQLNLLRASKTPQSQSVNNLQKNTF